MKANELMIGDWVLYNETPQQILEISGIDDEVYLETDELVHQSEIQPIPLTPEILEKNGFVDERSNYAYRTDNYHVCYYCADERLSINKYGAILDVHCFYVHDLQHALILCRIEKTIEL